MTDLTQMIRWNANFVRGLAQSVLERAKVIRSTLAPYSSGLMESVGSMPAVAAKSSGKKTGKKFNVKKASKLAKVAKGGKLAKATKKSAKAPTRKSKRAHA